MNSREQFEKWAEEDGCDMSLDYDGTFYSIMTEFMWQAWQASRECIEVELTQKLEDKTSDRYNIGYNNAIRSLENMLYSQGIKVKT